MERKGSGQVIAIILLLLVTVAVVAVTYTHFDEIVNTDPPAQPPGTPEIETAITENRSTAYDVCLSRNYDSEKWTTSHFKHCEHTLEWCQESQECLITYKKNRSTERYAHFHAEGDPLFLGWQIRLLEDELPGFLTLGTNYPNSTNYEEGTVGWQIWKEGKEKRERLAGGTASE